MKVFLLVVGDELLSGHTKDANAGWLTERLDALGHRVVRVVIAPDEDAVLREELDRGLAMADLVITTGGLGPTHDDRTTEVIAGRFNRKLVLDEVAWTRLRERYAKRFPDAKTPQEMIEAARKMVTIPDGAIPLVNPRGAASAYALDVAPGKRVIVLPGVPAELRAIFEQEVEGKMVPAEARARVEEIDLALPEAAFASALDRIQRTHADVAIGSYPHHGELRVTVRLRGAEKAVESAARDVREKFREHVLPRGS